MKHIFILLAIALAASCKKDLGVCSNYKEIKGREQAADISGLPQQLKDSLATHPQLVPYSVNLGAYVNGVLCRMYYNDIPVLSGDYSLYKQSGYGHDTVMVSGKIPHLDPGFSFDPAVSYKDAVKEAKKYANFDHACIAYQLGIYDLQRYSQSAPGQYRLAWKIMDSEKTYIYVIMDATTNQVLYYGSNIWVY